MAIDFHDGIEALRRVIEANGIKGDWYKDGNDKHIFKSERKGILNESGTLEQLELVLRRLGLDPYILQNNDGGSKTLIEALEQQIYKAATFGIVLLTPDDFGYPKSKTD